MICELCGRNYQGGYRVRLEGGLVSACSECAKLGKVMSEIKAVKPRPPKAVKAKPKEDVEAIESDVEYELVEGFGAKVKDAREKLRLTQEDLGRLINEPHSVIHRIELGKFEPPLDVARKFQHKLRVKLLTRREEVETPRLKQESKDLTLGDMIVVRKRNN